ncbi:MAG TPA: Holliday junction resolvase RuvX [Candidatus Kapabacteria bacterium]|nr:Holliday junction resolvase RuvX [Candidatus Kapabacteria bacterium]
MKNNTRVLAIDYGTKRIGLAISDELRILATAIGIIEHTERAIAELVKTIETERVAAVIIGLPRTMSGGESEMTAEVRGFAAKLQKSLEGTGVTQEFYDERMSSIIASSNIREQGLSKSKRKQKYRYDEEAARVILQEYLDSLR